MTRTPDPRKIISPASFAVATELLGTPLASPYRRAAAMLLDLFAVALLVNAGGVFFGMAAAVVLYRASGRRSGGSVPRRWARGALRFSAALILFVTVVSTWGFWEDDGRESEPQAAAQAEEAGEAVGIALSGLGLGPGDLIRLTTDVAELSAASSDADVNAAADRLAANLRENGVPESRFAEIADELRAEAGDAGADSRALEALRRAFGDDDVAPSASAADSLALAYATALAAGDSAAVSDLRPRLAGELSRDELAALRRRNERVADARDSLAAEVERLREGPGLLSYLRGLADDLGLGFGWVSLYFTALTALWRGQTLGKRLLGIRVIRLDGRPMGWWLAFERFGGYMGGLFTGLLGFVQIFWDRNRQGIHDKITETVVIRVGSSSSHARVPGA